MKKFAYQVMMSYPVSDAEKYQAEKSIIFFNQAEKKLDQSSKYLNLMLTPFKENPEMDAKEVEVIRAALRRYRDTAMDNFNQFKNLAFKCLNSMNIFSFDTQTSKLLKSFISEIEILEPLVNGFSDIFSNLEDKDFAKKIVDKIEEIQNQAKQISELINERIKKHIKENILSKNWTSQFQKKELNLKPVEPLLVQLTKEQTK